MLTITANATTNCLYLTRTGSAGRFYSNRVL